MKLRYFLFFAILLVFLCTPALAGTLFLSGGPDLSVAIVGSNEFSPGGTTKMNIVIENRGLIDLKIIEPEIVSRDDLPNTAKLMKVALEAGGAPLTVKSDPQMIGDITGGSSKIVTFDVKINADAKSGMYMVPVNMNYIYLESAEAVSQTSTQSSNIRYFYSNKTQIRYLTIRIIPMVRLQVVEATPEHLDVGTEGYLTLKIKNIGTEDAKKSVARISRNSVSPLEPTDSNVYIGDFFSGEIVTVRYKVAVSNSAEANQVYPLNIFMEYENFEGDQATSDTVTFGVQVGGKIEFSVISPPAEIYPGEKKVIEVTYKNVGSAEVFNAQARISTVEPFTSNDDTAYIGNIKPGGSVVARYEVSADSTATIKNYGIDSEIRYRDALDNPQISKTIKLQIIVVQREGILGSLTNPIVLSIVVVLCIGAAYYIVRVRKKK